MEDTHALIVGDEDGWCPFYEEIHFLQMLSGFYREDECRFKNRAA